MTTKTPLERFQAKPGDVVAVTGGSAEERALLGAPPEGATAGEPADAAVVAAVVHTRAELEAWYAAQLPVLGAARAVWVVYQKGGRADVNRDVIAGEARVHGWRGISNIAVDEVWSAVRVRPLKEGEE